MSVSSLLHAAIFITISKQTLVPFQTVADVEGFLKYLDKAENEINTADSISVDPETLRVQLRDHNVSSILFLLCVSPELDTKSPDV